MQKQFKNLSAAETTVLSILTTIDNPQMAWELTNGLMNWDTFLSDTDVMLYTEKPTAACQPEVQNLAHQILIAITTYGLECASNVLQTFRDSIEDGSYTNGSSPYTEAQYAALNTFEQKAVDFIDYLEDYYEDTPHWQERRDEDIINSTNWSSYTDDYYIFADFVEFTPADKMRIIQNIINQNI